MNPRLKRIILGLTGARLIQGVRSKQVLFLIRCTKVWNEMPMSSKNAFKTKTKQTLFEILASEDCHIYSPVIVEFIFLLACIHQYHYYR